MKKDQVKNLLGYRVRLRPIAKRPGDAQDLPQVDDDWTIDEVGKDRVVLSNIRTHHVATLGLDHVHNYLSDPARRSGEINYGFFQLRVQILLLPDSLKIEPLPPGDWGQPKALERKREPNGPAPADALESDITPTDKAFTQRTVRDLLSLYEGQGRTALQGNKLMEAFKGLWLSTQGQLTQLIPDDSGYTAILTINPTFVRPHSFPNHDLVNARFAKEWEAALSRLSIADTITIQGRIANGQNGHQLYLSDCRYMFSSPATS
jgi:hypothetical protein